MTEKEKMLSGLLYRTAGGEMSEQFIKCNKLCKEFNNLYEFEEEKRNAILKDLLGGIGEYTSIRGPIYFDFGCFTTFGKRCFVNFNLTVLDCNRVTIGDDVFFGPNVTIAPPKHPLLPEERMMRIDESGTPYDIEYAEPITIENNCWISSNVTICGGVTIGAGSIIGAGSVVTHDIPAGYIAYGVPCKPVRKITPEDEMFKKQGIEL